MDTPTLEQVTHRGVSYLTAPTLSGSVRFGFTERTGGVSQGAFRSLNLGERCGDAQAAVTENRRRALAALGAEDLLPRLVNPKQVHGSRILVVDSAEPQQLRAVRSQARKGADGIVCTAPEVPVLLCYADCVPVVLVAPHAFAALHSGWRGTKARISQVGLTTLCRAARVEVSEVRVYIGPHIGGADYQVSQGLLDGFVADFGESVRRENRCLDLGAAITVTLLEAGMKRDQIVDAGISTATNTDRFYSYRAEHGTCGRHGALAYIQAGGHCAMG